LRWKDRLGARDSQLAAGGNEFAEQCSSRYGRSIYNGNTDMTITELRILVTTKASGKEIQRPYVANATISPPATKNFGFDMMIDDEGTKYDWQIAGAKGY
jgi:hypothetical protein